MPLSADSPQAWLRYAESDLALAETTPDDRVMLENLCFHAQQAIEKCIKAVLIFKGIVFPKTHSIELLLDLLPSEVPTPQQLLDARELSGYATVTRYPGFYEPTSEGDHQNALLLARGALAWAKELIGG